jgi:hypothetical protein
MSATAARDATRDQDYRRLVALLFAFGGLAVLTVAAIVVAWSVPAAAAWAHSGRLPSLGVVDALRALGEPELRSGDPAAAYPAGVRVLLPGAWGFWTSGVLLWVTITAAVVAAAREVEVRMSRPTADRRWWQLRGRRPHEFGRYRTARELAVNGPSPERVIVGTFARPAALLAVQPNVQVLLVGAPRSGKTSAGLIPPLLEHTGPAVTTSVRTDVVRETEARRRRLGEVWVWDPFGERSDGWDPLAGCERWEHALLVARWLGHAVRLGPGHTQEYFDQEAEGLTAPLLHAAAHSADRTIVDVYRWILGRARDEPERILTDLGAADALERLRNVYGYTERQRDGIIGTAAVQLKAYGHPAAARTAARADGVSPEALFAPGAANTLYIVAGREHQRLLASLVVTMICSLLFYVAERENRSGRGLDPPALFALDETANIAPLQDLPQILATSLPSVRFLTVWHSVAQLRRHFGVDAAAEILALSQAKVFLGSITDHHTRQELVELLGRRQADDDGGRPADVLTAQALQRTGNGDGLLVHGELPPVFFRQRRHYQDADLQRLKAA